MVILKIATLAVAVSFLAAPPALSQRELAAQLAELAKLKSKVGDAETRVRVDALHRVWAIGMAANDSEVKTTALELLREPAGSSSDHIRMPAVYAIAEIANSTQDVQVKIKALESLREPFKSEQVPIRDIAIDAVNAIVKSAGSSRVSLAALQALGPAVRSGNNGVRIPAINAVVRALEAGAGDAACNAALDLLGAPLDSGAMIGGMEVRMMAVLAVERAGLLASEVRTKAKAMGILQSHASKGSWEPEAKKRAEEAAAAIQNSIDKRQ
jgi:hypothetical protein